MATLIQCPVCKQEISSSAGSCPHCGQPIRKNKCRSLKGGFISLAVGIGVCLTIFKLFVPENAASAPPIAYVGILTLIAGVVSACICFTSPTK